MTRIASLRRRVAWLALLCALPLTGGVAGAAEIVTDRPGVITLAWYWESQRTQEIQDPNGNQVTLELPNPFCPAPPGSVGDIQPTCAEGRLPVEVLAADYETPEMVPAVDFDFAAVPPGSTIERFTVSFLEARTGCRQTPDNPDSPAKCEATDSFNVGNKSLRACRTTEFFGAGEARPYRFMPKFSCADTAPTAQRKEITMENEDTGEEETRHVWNFDLTAYAQKWVSGFSPSTGVMLRPVEPENPDAADNWRVVLSGPKPERGMVTKLSYEPPAESPSVGNNGDDNVSTGSDFSGDAGFTPSSGVGSDFPTSTGPGTTTPETPAAEEPPVDTTEGDDLASAADVEQLPGYVWLAVLAGLVAFSLVRSVILDRAGGMRPDGVLAQIRRLNAERRGAAVAAVGATGGSGSFVRALKDIPGSLKDLGGSIRALVGRLPFGGRK